MLIYYIVIIIAGDIRGVDVVGSATFIYRGDATSFIWKDHGFKLYMPSDALPPGVSECHIQIKAALSGQFEFPEGAKLVSGVYCIHTSHCFTRPVTIGIQHCSTVDKSVETEHLSFVVSTGDQLPYCFQTLEGGKFSTKNLMGYIEVHHFSFLSIISNYLSSLIMPRLFSPKLYRAYLWYKETRSRDKWDVYFTIIPDTDLHFEVL